MRILAFLLALGLATSCSSRVGNPGRRDVLPVVDKITEAVRTSNIDALLTCFDPEVVAAIAPVEAEFRRSFIDFNIGPAMLKPLMEVANARYSYDSQKQTLTFEVSQGGLKTTETMRTRC